MLTRPESVSHNIANDMSGLLSRIKVDGVIEVWVMPAAMAWHVFISVVSRCFDFF